MQSPQDAPDADISESEHRDLLVFMSGMMSGFVTLARSSAPGVSRDALEAMFKCETVSMKRDPAVRETILQVISDIDKMLNGNLPMRDVSYPAVKLFHD